VGQDENAQYYCSRCQGSGHLPASPDNASLAKRVRGIAKTLAGPYWRHTPDDAPTLNAAADALDRLARAEAELAEEREESAGLLLALTAANKRTERAEAIADAAREYVAALTSDIYGAKAYATRAALVAAVEGK
jgi:hypothetical protein